ncbi:MAG: hypothetical protein ABJC26_11360 [Gemmatimonadaceae bacterium]
MSIEQANFEDLMEVYFTRTGAEKAAKRLIKLIYSEKDGDLRRLLRDHNEEAIVLTTEMNFRASVDELLIWFSVLEIATVAGFIAPPTHQFEFWKSIQTILSNNRVERYYKKYYPTRLPEMLLRRINGELEEVEAFNEELSRTMIQFLALDRRFMSKLNDSTLILLLDDFVIKGYDFSDVVKRIRDPEKFIKSLTLAPPKRDALDDAIIELNVFLVFLKDLQRLLSGMSDYPLFQSEVWNHYGYWFETIHEDFQSQINSALDQFLHWTPVDGKEDAVNSIQREIASARGVLTDLVSTKYATVVRRHLR